jgi:hypothetical protein
MKVWVANVPTTGVVWLAIISAPVLAEVPVKWLLFKILQEDTQLSTLRYVTPEGRMILAKVEQAIHNSQRTCVDYSQQFNFFFYLLQVYPQEFFGSLSEYYSGYICLSSMLGSSLLTIMW